MKYAAQRPGEAVPPAILGNAGRCQVHRRPKIMLSPRHRRTLFVTCALVVVFAGPAHGQQQARRAGYDQLVALFTEWRQFQRPKSVNDVPDYTAAAMTAQQRALPELQRRLAALDTAGWPRAQQVDGRIVRAELNGLDFDHR